MVAPGCIQSFVYLAGGDGFEVLDDCRDGSGLTGRVEVWVKHLTPINKNYCINKIIFELATSS